MPGETKEPQSYGSERDWTTGRTGSNVNDPKSTPREEHREFYDDKRASDGSAPHQGGDTSPVQLAESEQRTGRTEALESQPVSRVTTRDGGAKRDSFFRKRDYE